MPGATRNAPPRADDSRRGQNAPSARTATRGYTPPRAAGPAERLASNACPDCGEPRGARYAGRCWPCWSQDHPEPARKRRKPEATAVLVERVWATLERHGTVFSLADGTGRLLGYCPACSSGTVAVAVLRSPVRLRTNGCSAGCSAQVIAEALA